MIITYKLVWEQASVKHNKKLRGLKVSLYKLDCKKLGPWCIFLNIFVFNHMVMVNPAIFVLLCVVCTYNWVGFIIFHLCR